MECYIPVGHGDCPGKVRVASRLSGIGLGFHRNPGHLGVPNFLEEWQSLMADFLAALQTPGLAKHENAGSLKTHAVVLRENPIDPKLQTPNPEP